MKDCKVTVASLTSSLTDVRGNLQRVEDACRKAKEDQSRLLFLPELMLTGHGGHPKMVENAEQIHGGELAEEIKRLSIEYDICICVGIAEQCHRIVYNSYMVMDRGKYLGVQRKINLSLDESVYFKPGESLEVFDIGDLRFSAIICYDNHFPELAFLSSLDHVDLILSPHAVRVGTWNDPSISDHDKMQKQQDLWETLHRARARDHNVYVLLNNAVGSAVEGLENVSAFHAGTLMGVDPKGEVFLRTSKNKIEDEVISVELKEDCFDNNFGPMRNRRLPFIEKKLKSFL